jgi:hypothetical protein
MTSAVVVTSRRARALAQSVRIASDRVSVMLVDGREISVPVAEFPRLASASAAQRTNWKLIGGGEGIRWPDVDEDLSVEVLAGSVAPTIDVIVLATVTGGRRPAVARLRRLAAGFVLRNAPA